MYNEGDPRLLHPPHDEIIDDIYFEPEVSEPYTRRSEKQYDEDINYNENDNRLLHSPKPNDLVEIEDSLYDEVRLYPIEFERNQRNFYANNVNNLDNGLLKPPNFNNQINKSINVNKSINDYINSSVRNVFIKPGIKTQYNKYSLAPRLPSIHNNVNNNNEAINETINENIHINDKIDFTIHEVDDNEDEDEPPNVSSQPRHQTVTIPSTIQEPDDPQLPRDPRANNRRGRGNGNNNNNNDPPYPVVFNYDDLLPFLGFDEFPNCVFRNF
jgi:hypothetical protein